MLYFICMRSFDRRFRKTEQEIIEGSIKLLSKNGVLDVSIFDIAKEADVNRSTFYLHFKGVDDVVAALEDETIVQLAPFIKGPASFERDNLNAMFTAIKTNKLLFMSIVNSFSPRFEEKISRSFLYSYGISASVGKEKADLKSIKMMSLLGSLLLTSKTWISDNCRMKVETLSEEVLTLTASSYYNDLISR